MHACNCGLNWNWSFEVSANLFSIHETVRSDWSEEEVVVDGEFHRPKSMSQNDGHEERKLEKSMKNPFLILGHLIQIENNQHLLFVFSQLSHTQKKFCKNICQWALLVLLNLFPFAKFFNKPGIFGDRKFWRYPRHKFRCLTC